MSSTNQHSSGFSPKREYSSSYISGNGFISFTPAETSFPSKHSEPGMRSKYRFSAEDALESRYIP